MNNYTTLSGDTYELKEGEYCNTQMYITVFNTIRYIGCVLIVIGIIGLLRRTRFVGCSYSFMGMAGFLNVIVLVLITCIDSSCSYFGSTPGTMSFIASLILIVFSFWVCSWMGGSCMVQGLKSCIEDACKD
eukprot:UN04895